MGETDDRELRVLKSKLDGIKSDIDSNKGERKGFLSRLKEEFGLDEKEAGARREPLTKELESLGVEKKRLLALANEKMTGYGQVEV